MARRLNLTGRWTLVTGAASGLGREIARRLAGTHRANLVLSARRKERLDELRDELTEAHGIEAVVVPADLSDADDRERLVEQATADRALHGVILNAGVTHYGPFADMPLDRALALVQTNATSATHLLSLLLPHVVAQTSEGDTGDAGGVMLVSSMGGFLPMPYQAVYGATKAFVTSLGQALACEIARSGVSVTVFAPGGIATEMLDKSGLSKKFGPGDFGIMAADTCARVAVNAFLKRKRVAIPGLANRFSVLLMRLLPTHWTTAATARVYEGGYATADADSPPSDEAGNGTRSRSEDD